MESTALAGNTVVPRVSAEQNGAPQRDIASSNATQTAELAYQLWEQRGCPEGSAEQDWFEAEQQLQRPLATAAGTGG